jgi:hypothetical protein
MTMRLYHISNLFCLLKSKTCLLDETWTNFLEDLVDDIKFFLGFYQSVQTIHWNTKIFDVGVVNIKNLYGSDPSIDVEFCVD